MPHDKLDSIGGLESRDLLQSCILILAWASNLNMIATATLHNSYGLLLCTLRSNSAMKWLW